MLTSLISRKPLTLLALSLIVACGSSSGDTDGPDASASASEGATPGTSEGTSADPTTGEDTTSGASVSAGTSSGTDGPTGPDPTTAGGAGCGNGTLEDGEACDGADLGGQQCADVDPSLSSGTLACAGDCTFDTSGCMPAADAPLVAINELTSESVLAGPFMGTADAIELHNAGVMPVDMSGWKLSDDPAFPLEKTYVFPPGSTLAPGAFKVLIAKDEMTLIGDFPFGINNKEAETVILADPGGNLVDSVMIEGPKAAISFCRLPDGVGAWEQCEQTFGDLNKVAATACGNGKIEELEICDGIELAGQTCESLKLGFNGGTLGCTGKCRYDLKKCTTNSQLVINELESVDDDIEIFNAGDATVDLSGWFLTDDRVDAEYDAALDDAEMKFPNGMTIGAKKYLVIPSGLAPGQHPFGLGANGDTVTLFKAGPVIIDHVTYKADEALVSFCRQPNGPGGQWTPDCTPTMGAPN